MILSLGVLLGNVLGVCLNIDLGCCHSSCGPAPINQGA